MTSSQPGTPRAVLVAVDFSDRSRVALGYAARLAHQFDAGLHVMHAQDPLLAAGAHHHGIDLARETRAELEAFAASARPTDQRLPQFTVVTGTPAAAIVETAERIHADVIVVAEHGMSPVRHAVLGSTTEGVLRRSGVSVLVVPDDWAPASADGADLQGEGPIIVGMDFDEPSMEAAKDAHVMAAALKTEVVLVHVVPSLHVLPRWRARADAAILERLREARLELETLVGTLGGAVPTHIVVEHGRVASCLTEVARSYPHAMVMVGRSTHGTRFAPPGKTAYSILTETTLPVLMHVRR